MSKQNQVNRRQFLSCALAGCAASVLGPFAKLSLAADLYAGHPLAPKLTHHPAESQKLNLRFF